MYIQSMKITEKLTKEFNEYNALMRRLGSKTKTMEQYIAYRSGKQRRYRGKGVPKSPMEATTLRREAPKYPSGDTYQGTFVAAKKEQQYTGDKLMGIGIMHKSNLVPIFKQEDAEEIAKMRR